MSDDSATQHRLSTGFLRRLQVRNRAVQGFTFRHRYCLVCRSQSRTVLFKLYSWFVNLATLYLIDRKSKAPNSEMYGARGFAF